MIDISTPQEQPLPIPSVGEKVFIERNTFEIIYINYGRGRMTCKLLDESDLSIIGKTFMFKGVEFVVTYVDERKKKFVFEPYEGEENETQT